MAPPGAATVVDRFERGDLPDFRFRARGGPVRFDEGELREWLEGRRHGQRSIA